MIKRKIKKENFRDVSDELWGIWEDICDMFDHNDDFIPVIKNPVSHIRVYADKDGSGLWKLEGQDYGIEISHCGFGIKQTLSTIKNQKDYEKWYEYED